MEATGSAKVLRQEQQGAWCCRTERQPVWLVIPTKVRLVKAMVFPVVCMDGESWTIEHRRIDAFELWCWRRPLRVPWTERRSNQSILKEISPEYSLGSLMLKLKLQYIGHLRQELTHWKRPCCWERLRAEGKGGDRG